MVFNYSPGSTNAKDDIRLLIGDTDPHAHETVRLEDEEIERYVVLLGNKYRAAAEAASTLAAKFARKADGSQGPDGVPFNVRAQELRTTAGHLRSLASASATPTFGGGSVSGKAAVAENTDRVKPAFTRSTLDNP